MQRRENRSRPAIIENLEGRQYFGGDVTAHINFQPAAIGAVGGYDIDAGAIFADRGNGFSYGWVNDNAKFTKFKNSKIAPDNRYRTYSTLDLKKNPTWELALPNGEYSLHLVVGKGGATGKHGVDVEGVSFINARSSKNSRWIEVTKNVTITDGDLTITNTAGFRKNFLTYLDISAPFVEPDPGDPTAPTVAWTTTAAPVAPIARNEGGSVQVGNKLYFIGGLGQDPNRVDVLDLVTRQFTQLASLPAAAPTTHSGYVTDGTSIYVISGQIGDLNNRVGTPTSWRYDIAGNTWTQFVSLPEVRFGAAYALHNNKIYIIGGNPANRTDITTTNFVLDLANQGAGWQTKAAIPLGGDHIAAAVVGNFIYAIGGETGHEGLNRKQQPGAHIAHNYNFRYDPATDSWTRLADLPIAISSTESATVVKNGKIVIFGGLLGAKDPTDAIQIYDPTTNRWTVSSTKVPYKVNGAIVGITNGGNFYLTNGATLGIPALPTAGFIGTPTGI